MSVSDLLRKRNKELSKELLIYNPDHDDFTVKYRGVPYTIKAMETARFPFAVAEHITKHLSTHLVYKRNGAGNFSQLVQEAKKEIMT